MVRRHLLPWAVRLSWAVLPLTVGPALGDAADPRSRGVQLVVAAVAWAGWAAGVLATLVPSTIALTVVRMAAPAAVASAAGTVWSGPASTAAQALALGTAAVALVLVLLPETGQWFVNGAAYPNERRYPLRPPAAVLLGILPLAWALCLGPPVAAALLLAGREWVLGGAVAVVAVPLAVVLARAVHGLSRRWLVFVPGGVVVHDPMTLADPVLFRRQVVASLGPAVVGTPALDLTQRAPGLALELALTEPVPLVRTTPGQRGGRPESPTAVLVAPTRPGAVLREAEARGIPRAAGVTP